MSKFRDNATRGPSREQPSDLAFKPYLTLRSPDDLEAQLALPPASSSGGRQVRSTILANLLLASARDLRTGLHYSRDRNFYASEEAHRYWGPCFTYANVVTAVKNLVAIGLVQEDRAPPSPRPSKRSCVFPTDRLLATLRTCPAAALTVRRHELIAIRDTHKRDVGYRETRQIKKMRRDVRAQNEAQARLSIEIAPDVLPPDERGFWRHGEHLLFPGMIEACRIFNIDVTKGGRWYGPWWQRLPSQVRKAITIDGVPTVELDFHACHPRLLAAAAGIDVPFDDASFDFYGIAGIERRHAKLAVNILLNAEDVRAARCALAKELRQVGEPEPHACARNLIVAVRQAWPALSRFWSTGIGLRLQAIDAAVCARVQRQMRERGRPCLSVHDSFIVEHRAEVALRDVMNAELSRACAVLRAHPRELISGRIVNRLTY